jgi:hypothetical protein
MRVDNLPGLRHKQGGPASEQYFARRFAMTAPMTTCLCREFQRWLAWGCCWVVLAAGGGGAIAAEEISTAAAVRSLSVAESRQGVPVRLRGVVTFFDETLYSRFIQDETAGIYLRESTNTPPLRAGQVVEVEGT